MKIAQKVKVALDETRMLVLGAQILIGFQFRGVFQDLYSQLPAPSRYPDGVALLLMVATLALLILPGTYHRLVEKGNASGRLHALTNKLAVTALIPFTVSLGIDVGITGERILGPVGGITAGVLVGALALQMLTEARVILPGSQALLGFQLAIVLTQAFEKLLPTVKMVHGAICTSPQCSRRQVFSSGGLRPQAAGFGSIFRRWHKIPQR